MWTTSNRTNKYLQFASVERLATIKIYCLKSVKTINYLGVSNIQYRILKLAADLRRDAFLQAGRQTHTYQDKSILCESSYIASDDLAQQTKTAPAKQDS